MLRGRFVHGLTDRVISGHGYVTQVFKRLAAKALCTPQARSNLNIIACDRGIKVSHTRCAVRFQQVVRCAGLCQGLQELLHREHRNAQSITGLEAGCKHGRDGVLRDLSQGKHWVQHNRLAQHVREPSEELQAWNGHVADGRESIHIQRVGHTVDFLDAVPEHADGVLLGVHLFDLFGHLSITHLKLSAKVNHLKRLVVAHRAVDGVLSPAHHVIEHVIHRRIGALQSKLGSLDLHALDKLLWATALIELLITIERHVGCVVQHALGILHAPQIAVDHGLHGVRTDALPCVADILKLGHVFN